MTRNPKAFEGQPDETLLRAALSLCNEIVNREIVFRDASDATVWATSYDLAAAIEARLENGATLRDRYSLPGVGRTDDN